MLSFVQYKIKIPQIFSLYLSHFDLKKKIDCNGLFTGRNNFEGEEPMSKCSFINS